MPTAPRRGRACLLALAAATTAALATAPVALASHTQIALFQEPTLNAGNAERTLTELGRLGVGTVRVLAAWTAIAPGTYAARPPRRFDATDPGSRRYSFADLDAVIEAAAAHGIAVDLSLTGPAPRWANGPGKPRGSSHLEWRPNAAQFGSFALAVARRYSGAFVPKGAFAPLPRIGMWEIWNEPNFGPDLAPQAVNGSTVPVAAPLYRSLVDAAWTGLMRAGHRGDTIVLGNLDARGQAGPPSRRAPEGFPGNFAATKPLLFIRQLFCVDSALRPLRGAAARQVAGCPTTSAGSRAFRSAHPALFNARGFGDHPYPFTTSPTQTDTTDPDQGEFAQLPRMIRMLDGVERAYHSGHRFGLYNTEYGYITDPPNRSQPFASPALAAAYINEAEYLSYINPRITSTMQFLLRDPDPRHAPEYGGFASGLKFHSGRHKPSYDAYRLPLWLPSATIRRGSRLLVWGAVRPAMTLGNRTVEIQYRAGAAGRFTTLAKVIVTRPRGYFEARVRVPRSGAIRLAWGEPVPTPALPPDRPYAEVLAPPRPVDLSRIANVTVR